MKNDESCINVQRNVETGGVRVICKEVIDNEWTGKWFEFEITDRDEVISLALTMMSAAGCDANRLTDIYNEFTNGES